MKWAILFFSCWTSAKFMCSVVNLTIIASMHMQALFMGFPWKRASRPSCCTFVKEKKKRVHRTYPCEKITKNAKKFHCGMTKDSHNFPPWKIIKAFKCPAKSKQSDDLRRWSLIHDHMLLMRSSSVPSDPFIMFTYVWMNLYVNLMRSGKNARKIS